MLSTEGQMGIFGLAIPEPWGEAPTAIAAYEEFDKRAPAATR